MSASTERQLGSRRGGYQPGTREETLIVGLHAQHMRLITVITHDPLPYHSP
jgi:hypothetical protein